MSSMSPGFMAMIVTPCTLFRSDKLAAAIHEIREPRFMCIAQLLNRQCNQIVDDEGIVLDCAEAAEGHAGAFCVGTDEIGDITRNRQNVTRLILAEEQGMGRTLAFAEADVEALARGHRHFSERQHEAA